MKDLGRAREISYSLARSFSCARMTEFTPRHEFFGIRFFPAMQYRDLLPRQVHLVADDGGAGVETVVELVGRQDLEGVGVLDHDGHAVAAGTVYAVRRADGRGVDLVDSLPGSAR